MINIDCFINKNFIKVSYPNKIMLDLLYAGKKGPFEICTSEILPGDIIVLLEKNKYIYLVSNGELNQISGDRLNFFDTVNIEVKNITKISNIKNYILQLFKKLTLTELINFKNDFETFEHNLVSYFLETKNSKKMDFKKIRTIIFKAFKDPKLCEKIYSLITKDPFDGFNNDSSQVIINFSDLTVQIIND